MTILMPHIAARLFNQPLMVDPGKLAAILVGIGGRVVEGGILLPDVQAIDHTAFARGRPSDSMGKVGDPLGRSTEGRRIYSMYGNVAVLPVEGTLVHKGRWIGQSSGETSYEGLNALINRARNDSSVKGVVFEVDSFGGEVAGAFETAAMIRDLSAAKPTLAILTDFALSAGYLMASQARQVVMPETGAAGSIGVVTMHVDMSKALEQRGFKVTLLHSGKHKVDGNSTEPLPEEVRARIQERLDQARGLFADAVAAGRGNRLGAKAALATEAQIFEGRQAVKAGLVDGLIDPGKAFKAFVDRLS